MKIFLIIILLSFIHTVLADEVKTEIKIIPQAQEYKEGELVEIDIKIWPLENADLTEFQKIEGTELYNSINVTQIISIEPSENNADVVVIKANGIILKAPDGTPHALHYKNLLIDLAPIGFKFIPFKSRLEDYYVLNQSLTKRYLKTIISVLTGLLILLIFLYRKKIFVKKDPKKELQLEYKILFQKAETRQDFEEIYAKRKYWLPLLVAETNAHREFFKIMEIHQYKKDWSTEDTSEVKNSFDIIKGSF